MINTSKTIIFFGTEQFSLTILESLVEAGYLISAVVTKPDSKRGRGHKLTPPPVKIFALEHGIPVWQPVKVVEVNDRIKESGATTGVLVSYGKIIPKSTIDLFAIGIINVHPSLLPKYRGPSPIESAIKNGDHETGVSIMKLSPAMDAGPVYTQKKYILNGIETSPNLYKNLAVLGGKVLLEVLPSIISRALIPTPQDEDKVTYCKLLEKTDADLDLTQLTAVEAERRIRAYLNFPKSKLSINHHNLVVTRAHVSGEQKTPLDLRCRDGVFLSIDELIGPSGRRMDAASFLRGYAA